MILTISVLCAGNSMHSTSERILPKGSKLHTSITLAVKSVTRANHEPLMCVVLLAVQDYNSVVEWQTEENAVCCTYCVAETNKNYSECYFCMTTIKGDGKQISGEVKS